MNDFDTDFEEYCIKIERALKEKKEKDPVFLGMKDAVKEHANYCKKINGMKISIGLFNEGPEHYYFTPKYLDGYIIDDACNCDKHFCETFKQAVSAIIDALENELKDDFYYSISQNESYGVTDTESFIAKQGLITSNSEIFEVTIVPKQNYTLVTQGHSQMGIYIPIAKGLKIEGENDK